jgi:nudix-type nucleoside diphosphatase (YffH/AdpP family)
VVNLRIDTVELMDGRSATREVVEHGDVVAVVPLLEDQDVLLVRQYRLPAGQTLLEVPAGGVDTGESSEEAAQRELGEECGQRAERLDRLGGFYASPGFCSEFIHVFLATRLSPVPAHPDPDEEIAVVRLPLAEAVRLTRQGEIRDAKSIIALTWTSQKVAASTVEHK